MSSSDPGQSPPGADGPEPSHHSDLGTDPGRSQPYESLYRTTSDVPGSSHRTTARHFEPALTPPEEQSDPGDRFHWLYRPEPQAPEPESPEPGNIKPGIHKPGSPEADRVVPVSAGPDSAGPVSAGPVRAGPISSGQRRTGPEDPFGPVPAAHGADQPATAPAADAPPDDRESTGGFSRLFDASAAAEDPEQAAVAGGSRTRKVLVILVVLLLIAAGVVAAVTLAGRRPSRGAQEQVPPSGRLSATVPSASASGAATASVPVRSAASSRKPSGSERYVGDVAPIVVTRVTADCRAKASTDGAGRRVRYDPEQLTDGDPSTAWRCDGSGKGRSVTFAFGQPREVAELGLVNGYAKTDPRSAADRYGEYRRVEEVRWTFPDGSSFTQELADKTEKLQTMRIPSQTADRVELTITRSTSPGSRASTRDAVLISEAAFAAPQT